MPADSCASTDVGTWWDRGVQMWEVSSVAGCWVQAVVVGVRLAVRMQPPTACSLVHRAAAAADTGAELSSVHRLAVQTLLSSHIAVHTLLFIKFISAFSDDVHPVVSTHL